jgi:hypothetical protein
MSVNRRWTGSEHGQGFLRARCFQNLDAAATEFLGDHQANENLVFDNKDRRRCRRSADQRHLH